MAIQFGAAKITIDRGDHTDNFRLKRSIPLAEALPGDDGEPVREVVENDDAGRALYKSVRDEMKLLKPLLDQAPDTVELRLTRVPHPAEPENPAKDTVTLRWLEDGKYRPGFPVLGGISSDDFGQHRSLQLFGLLRKMVQGN